MDGRPARDDQIFTAMGGCTPPGDAAPSRALGDAAVSGLAAPPPARFTGDLDAVWADVGRGRLNCARRRCSTRRTPGDRSSQRVAVPAAQRTRAPTRLRRRRRSCPTSGGCGRRPSRAAGRPSKKEGKAGGRLGCAGRCCRHERRRGRGRRRRREAWRSHVIHTEAVRGGSEARRTSVALPCVDGVASGAIDRRVEPRGGALHPRLLELIQPHLELLLTAQHGDLRVIGEGATAAAIVVVGRPRQRLGRRTALLLLVVVLQLALLLLLLLRHRARASSAWRCACICWSCISCMSCRLREERSGWRRCEGVEWTRACCNGMREAETLSGPLKRRRSIGPGRDVSTIRPSFASASSRTHSVGAVCGSGGGARRRAQERLRVRAAGCLDGIWARRAAWRRRRAQICRSGGADFASP